VTRVLVNLTWLVPGVVGGSEESTTDALRAVLAHRDDVELTLAVLEPFAAAHPDLAEACALEVLEHSGANKVARVAAEQTWLAGRTEALAPDVVHHAGGVVPVRHPGTSVLTIHDVQPLDLPGNFSVAKRWYLRAMLGRSVRAAEIVCVPSEFTRGRVIDRVAADPARVTVVPWCSTGAGSVAPGGELPREPGEVPAAAGPVFVYPAITHAHKNHAVLLEAFSRYSTIDPTARLVLAGGSGAVDAEVRRRITMPDLAGKVRRPGRVAPEEMERLYRRATAVLVPSRYEGFGLPALEAMKRGVPLVVSTAGSLPEVVRSGDGGAVTVVAPVDPDDVGGWLAAMQTTAGLDDERRHAIALAEVAAASAFTPQRTADALADAYLRAAGLRPVA